MSSIILRNTPHAAEGDTEVVDFSIVVEDADWVGLYDRIQVFRSTQGSSGPFEELTAANWEVPRLPVDGGDAPVSPVTGPLINIVGAELVFDVLGQAVTITFTGSDPLTYAQVAAQIAAQSLGRLRSYVDASGELVVEGNYPGLIAQLTILSSDGAILLGLPTIEPDNTASGKDPRIGLSAGTTSYTFRDPFGSRDYFYRTRLLNQTTGEASDYSISFSANDGVGVAFASTIVGYVELVDLAGKPMVNAQVYVYNGFDGSQVDTKLVTGGTALEMTDESGRAEFTLVRGQRLTVSVQGTTLIRSITVPTDPTLATFNLFDPSIGEVDVFRVNVPDIVTAERRTL